MSRNGIKRKYSSPLVTAMVVQLEMSLVSGSITEKSDITYSQENVESIWENNNSGISIEW